jgi:GTPase SAR1 family protein
MTIDPLTTALEKELAKVVITGAASVLDSARKWYRSYDLLIVGQERAGKTAFYKFLHSQFLSRDGEQTVPTVDDVNSGIFKFEWTTDSGVLVVELRNVGDRSGQIGPHAHARMFARQRPHLLVIILDISTREDTDRLHASYGRWLEYFCTYVAERLMKSPRIARRLRSRLRNVVILLNKADTIPAEQVDAVIGEATARIRATLQTRLRNHLGAGVDTFPILPCSIVSNPRYGTPIDTITRLKEVVRQLVSSTITR